MNRTPNIIFITADQLGAKWLGCYGSGVASTPQLDLLAASGTRFDRYYATHPVCAPNRATMLTGRSASAHGIVTNNYALATDMPTYAHVLGRQGYRTAGFGKFHQTPMAWPVPTDLAFLGFHESVVSEDPKWGPYVDWVSKHHPGQYDVVLAMANGHSGDQGPSAEVDRRQGAAPQQVERRREVYHEILGERIEASEWDRMYSSPLEPQAHDTTFITECALDFISRQSQAEPFLCAVSYVDPHDPFDPPEPYATLFDPAAMPPPIEPEWKDSGPACLAAVQHNYLDFAQIADDPGAVRKMRALYHGQLKLLDDQIGRLIASLRDSGLWENTIVVFTTDHGEHLGDHGMIAKGFAHYDAGIRCPLIVGGGAIERSAMGYASDRLSCTLDLYPTFCDWAGVPEEARPPLEGRSLLEAPEDQERHGRAVLITHEQVSTVVTDDWFRLTWYPESREGQLFSLAADPDEERNLYDDPEYARTRTRLFEAMTTAYAASISTPHYRNMACRDGLKWDGNGAVPVGHYEMPSSPWLRRGTARPEWHGDEV